MIESSSVTTKCALHLAAPVLATILMLLSGCAGKDGSLHGSPYPSPTPAPALALSDTEGATFNLTSLSGHSVLVYFGYTQCQDECPLTLANASWVIEQLGASGDQVEFILVTVDPANDTPAVLRAYLDKFNPRFIGLTGTEEQLALARSAYGVPAATPEAGLEHADVLHGTRLYLIGPDGRLLTSYDLSIPQGTILDDLRSLLEAAG